MRVIQRFGSVAAAAVLLAASGAASAQQARATIIAQPAVLTAAGTTSTPVDPIRNAAPIRAVPTSIVIVAPTPFPPLPPNFCFRGNSAGVSRC